MTLSTLMTVIWGIFAVILIAIELFNTGILAIWFAIGAVVAAILAGLGFDIIWQFVAFFVISIPLAIVATAFFRKKQSQATSPKRVYSIIDKTAIVTKEIDTKRGNGQISVNGDLWSAKSKDEDQIIPEDTKVKVLEIDGVKAVVEVIK